MMTMYQQTVRHVQVFALPAQAQLSVYHVLQDIT